VFVGGAINSSQRDLKFEMRILKSKALNPKSDLSSEASAKEETIPKSSNPKPKTKPLLAIAIHGQPLSF